MTTRGMTAAAKPVLSGESEFAADEYREGGTLKHRRIPQGDFEILEPDEEGKLSRRALSGLSGSDPARPLDRLSLRRKLG